MAGVSKNICFYITERCFRFAFNDRITFEDLENEGRVVYQGLARNWEKYEEDDFQKFMEKQDIKPSDEIAIACWTKDAYIVIRSS